MNLKSSIAAMLFIAMLWSCSVTQKGTKAVNLDMIKSDLLIDSILQEGLDGEALYTILASIKPMSSVAGFYFPIGNPDSNTRLDPEILTHDSTRVYLAKLQRIQQALNTLNIPDLEFVLTPYRGGYSKNKAIQVNVIRISSLDSLLGARQSFFGQFGLMPGADPAVVLTVNEFEKRYERLRGYGYLFGYPDYAVDFFVQASFVSDSTGTHVERNFFQIPTFSRDEGNFVYAYSKDHQPSGIDTALYERATEVLAKYKAVRSNYLRADSTLMSLQLIKDFMLLK